MAVIMLRFHTTQPTTTSPTFAHYREIAHALNLTYHEVQHMCRTAHLTPRPMPIEKRVRQLSEHHVQFLISPSTLEKWAGFTMKQRTVYFHRQFTDKRIAVTSLRRLYQKHGIKRKKVRQEKSNPWKDRRGFVEECQKRLDQLADHRGRGRLIVFLDETVFSKKALKLQEYSAKNTSLCVE